MGFMYAPLFGIPLPMCVINKTHICKTHLNDSHTVPWWDLSRVQKCYSYVSLRCFPPSFRVVVRCKIASTWYEGVKNAPFDRQHEGKTFINWTTLLINGGLIASMKVIFVFRCLPSPPLLLLLVDFSHNIGCQILLAHRYLDSIWRLMYVWGG
jgi:hypothetical protein